MIKCNSKEMCCDKDERGECQAALDFNCEFKEKGLWGKYIITKASGKPLNPNFYAIVLRIDGGQYVEACREGVKAFAEAVKEANPLLCEDIKARLWAYGMKELSEDMKKNERPWPSYRYE